MAAFLTPANAVSAAIAMRDEIASFKTPQRIAVIPTPSLQNPARAPHDLSRVEKALMVPTPTSSGAK